MIKTKSIYDPKSADDGLRVLVTRYWPRGVKKEAVDIWFKDLGPAPALIKLWKGGEIPWSEFKRSYKKEYGAQEKKKLLEELQGLVKGLKGKDATLLCTCSEEEHCHRRILYEMLER